MCDISSIVKMTMFQFISFFFFCSRFVILIERGFPCFGHAASERRKCMKCKWWWIQHERKLPINIVATVMYVNNRMTKAHTNWKIKTEQAWMHWTVKRIVVVTILLIIVAVVEHHSTKIIVKMPIFQFIATVPVKSYFLKCSTISTIYAYTP